MSNKQRRCPARRCAASVAIVLGTVVLAATSSQGAMLIADLGDQFNLQDLIDNNDSIVVGDKKFDLWGYSRQEDDNPNNNMPLANAVNIIAVSIGGNFGVTIQGGFGDVPGDAFFSDVSLFYRVTVTGEQRISDAHFDANIVIAGASDATGLFNVTEDFYTDDNGALGDKVGTISVTVGQQGGESFSDLPVGGKLIFFDEPHESLHIRKDIIAYAEDGLIFTFASLIDQTYSQTPEPASFALVATAMLTLGLRRRRSRR